MHSPIQQIVFVLFVLIVLLVGYHTKIYENDYSLEKLKFGIAAFLLKVLPAPYHCNAYSYLTGSFNVFPALSFEVWKHIDEILRPGDVIQSSMVKSGTTWSRHLLNQIRNKGQTDFEDLLEEVPFCEFTHFPAMTWKEKKQYFFNTNWGLEKNKNKIRLVATHNTIKSIVPFRDYFKYVVVVRNPYEITASYFPYSQSMHLDLQTLYANYYNSSCIDQRFKNYDEFFYVWSNFMLPRMVFDFIKEWWPYKDAKNVFFIHYSDLIGNTKQTIIDLAKFLNIELTQQELNKVLENVSFQWMKENHKKFDGSIWPKHFEKKKLLKRNFTSYYAETFTRKGKTGNYKTELAQQSVLALKKMIDEQIPDEEMRNYLLKQ